MEVPTVWKMITNRLIDKKKELDVSYDVISERTGLAISRVWKNFNPHLPERMQLRDFILIAKALDLNPATILNDFFGGFKPYQCEKHGCNELLCGCPLSDL